MNHSQASSLRNPPITSKRLVSSQPLASASITRFFKKEVGSSPTFPENDLGMVIGFPLFDYLLIIHSATALSLFSACSLAFSLVEIFIFLRALGCQGFLLSSSSSLLLLLSLPSSLPPLLGGIFLELLWFLIFFLFPLLNLLDL